MTALRRGGRTKQSDLFWRSEGDAWFRRNREAIGAGLEEDPVLRLIAAERLRPSRVLEIGASNGYRLARISETFGCSCVAVEPSAEAIGDGSRRFPSVEFRRGRAERLPVARHESFDLVIVHFVLHWLDRALLLPAVAEIDRALADEGHLLLGDFLPDEPTKVPYHHRPDDDMFTFKQDYSAVFIASSLYRERGRLVYDHARAPDAPADPARRCAVVCLQKSLDRGYVPGVYPPA